jgi:hypothetical protein
MKLTIEKWLLDRGYSSNVKKLFNESVVCYKNDANRAALIFSYIGFLTILKETIIKSQIPSNYTVVEWKDLINRINNDELWESNVFDLTQNTKKPLFLISDDLRLQIRYWKDRRNDCAHFKKNEIESYHVDSFWSFIQSNIPKITIEGGIASLLNKFDIHFDFTQTPPNSSFDHLIKEIPSSVLANEKGDFISKLEKTIEGDFYFDSINTRKVYNRIFEIGDENTKEELRDFLLKKDAEYLVFLNSYPDKISYFDFKPNEVRAIWTTKIYSKSILINPFNIYSGLLRSGLISGNEIEEANKALFNKFSQTTFHNLPEGKDIDTLKDNGFFDIIHKTAIIEKDLKSFMWVNSKCDLIILHFKHIPFSLDTVKSICNMAVSTNPSQWLVKELKTLFINRPALKVSFIDLANKNSIPIPKDFK